MLKHYFAPHPLNHSLGAYKEWIRSIAVALGAQEDPTVDTPEAWTKAWIDYWEAFDKEANTGSDAANKE